MSGAVAERKGEKNTDTQVEETLKQTEKQKDTLANRQTGTLAYI